MPLLKPPADRPGLEVADIFRGEAASFLRTHAGKLSPQQRRVFSDIQACRTAVMGGHVRACEDCGHREVAYNSCRNRHCPKCQAMARADWLAEREAELLPIAYFHIVFTLPAEVAAVSLQNKRLLYGMLFEAASQTLAEVAANSRHLGAAQIGFLAVLHTWGQNLMHHPHLHCVVGGGGPSQDASRWIASRDYYFLPVKVLSRVFRNKFCRLLEEAFNRGELGFYGKQSSLAEPKTFRRFLDAATRRPWVVYAKRPFREPACVLKYLARYTHRVAISNRRLVDYRDGKVTFRYKDYVHQGRQRTMTLSAAEFIRRFLLHVLPDGFMRIRHYGYLANRHRRQKLETCRRLLGCEALEEPGGDIDPSARESDELGEHAGEPCPRGDAGGESETAIRCPVCKTGWMRTVDTFDRRPRRCGRPPTPPSLPSQVPYEDSS
jgi:hypothetical protein